MLSGQRLFAHANSENVWALVATGQFTRLSQVAPQLPWRLSLLVQRALKLEAKRRPSSAAELSALLERFLNEHGGPDDPALRLTEWLVAVGKVPEETLTAMLPNSTEVYVIHEELPLRRRAVPWRVAALVSMLVTSVLLAGTVFFTDAGARLTSLLQ
jgi:hypothetical protein